MTINLSIHQHWNEMPDKSYFVNVSSFLHYQFDDIECFIVFFKQWCIWFSIGFLFNLYCVHFDYWSIPQETWDKNQDLACFLQTVSKMSYQLKPLVSRICLPFWSTCDPPTFWRNECCLVLSFLLLCLVYFYLSACPFLFWPLRCPFIFDLLVWLYLWYRSPFFAGYSFIWQW